MKNYQDCLSGNAGNRENAVDNFLFGDSSRPIIGRGYEKRLVQRVLEIIKAEREDVLSEIEKAQFERRVANAVGTAHMVEFASSVNGTPSFTPSQEDIQASLKNKRK
jgi:hypothetical protein